MVVLEWLAAVSAATVLLRWWRGAALFALLGNSRIQPGRERWTGGVWSVSFQLFHVIE